MNSEENIAQFDDYLNDKLSDQENKEFLNRLENNAEFKAVFEEYKSLSEEIKKGAEYGELSKKLDRIHNDLNGRSSFIKKPVFYIPAAIAAMIVVLLMIFPPNFMEQGEMADTSATEDVAAGGEEEKVEMTEEGTAENNADEELIYSDSTNNDITLNVDSALTLEYSIADPAIANAVIISTDGLFATSLSALGNRDTFTLQNKCENIDFKVWIELVDQPNNLAILKCSKEDALNLKHSPTLLTPVPNSKEDEGILMNRSDTIFSKRKGTVLYRENCSKNAFIFITYKEMEEEIYGRALFLEGRFMLGVMVSSEADKRTTCVVPSKHIIELMDENRMDDKLNLAASTKESAIKVDPIEFVYTVH